MKNKFYRDDMKNMSSLLFEGNGIDDDFDMGMDDGMDDGMDFDMGMDEPQESEVVMEFEPEAPVMAAHEISEVLASDLKKLVEYAQRLQDTAGEVEMEDWMVAKITIAAEYVSDVWHRLDVKADFANTGVEQSQEFEM